MNSLHAAAAIYRFGDFTFDCARRLLLRGTVECHVSPKAQQLLHLLIAERPRVVSREELYDALWPSTFVSETNLAGIVNELRRALGDDARTSLFIRTVHGFGYAFCGEIASVSAVREQSVIVVYEGRKYLLYEGENLLGRASDCRVVIRDSSISRRHAAITVKGNTFTIHDAGSKNGTYVEGHRIGRTPVALTERSQVHLALVALTFERRAISSTSSLQLDIRKLKREVAERLANGRRYTPSPN
jgi:DNA-binding winged helix-turn-helix (wHTH) protein